MPGEPEVPGLDACAHLCPQRQATESWRDWCARRSPELGPSVAAALALLGVPPAADINPENPVLNLPTPLRERGLARAMAALDRTLLVAGYRCSPIAHEPSEV